MLSRSRRALGALFYLPPDSPAVAPILLSLRERKLLEDWPFGAPEMLAPLGQDVAAALSGQDATSALVVEYQRLFLGPEHLEAPPWGSVYLEEEGSLFGETTLALRSFLEAQGVTLNTGIHEPDDHIGLLFWAAAWFAEQRRPQALRSLLDLHLLPWAANYLGRLGKSARHAFYKALARLAFVTLQGIRAQMAE